jgi:CRISPR-associated protein Csd2
MPFFVNPTAALKSGCTRQDIELVLRLVPFAYPHTASYVRPSVEVRHAWYVEHNNSLGSCSDFALLKALTPSKKTNPDRPSACWEDYTEPNTLPQELVQRVAPLRDLIAEV